MNILAKHFFDYQSFVNLPHKAIQLNKIPPSQAGCDPSAAWAPKSMHLAGKNQSSPAARANRHYEEHKSGRHRHGRPSKLEFRHWGERHGELHDEKIVPHKDPWMTTLKGDFKHFYEYDKTFDSDGVDSALQHFPTFSQQCVEVEDMEVLTILTLTSRMNLIMITIKGICNFTYNICPLIKVQIFEGSRLVDERLGKSNKLNKYDKKVFLIATKKNYNMSTLLLNKRHPRLNQRFSRGFGKIVESQMHPNILMYCQKPQTNLNCKNYCLNYSNHFLKNCLITNRNKFLKFLNFKLTKTKTNKKTTNQDFTFAKEENKYFNNNSSPTFNKSQTFSLMNSSSKNKYQNYTNLSENFTFKVSAARLQQFHILVQIYVPYKSTSPSSSSTTTTNINKNSSSNTNEILVKNSTIENKCNNLFNQHNNQSNKNLKNEVFNKNKTNITTDIQNINTNITNASHNLNSKTTDLNKTNKNLEKNTDENKTNNKKKMSQSSKFIDSDDIADNVEKKLSKSKNKKDSLFDSSCKSESYMDSDGNYSHELELLSEQFHRLNSFDSINLNNEIDCNSLNNEKNSQNCFLKFTKTNCKLKDNYKFNKNENFNCDKRSDKLKFEKHENNIMLGGFVIGPLSSSRGRWHWRQMIQRHGYPVCMWHKLIQPVVTI